MYKKPILLRKLRNKKRYVEETIGLLGVHNGAGVTYTGLLLASFMSDFLERHTAFIECNENQDFKQLQASYDWSKEETDKFSFQRITFYKGVKKNQLVDIKSKEFSSYIIDYGANLDENTEEFIRCDKKFVVCGSAEWNKTKLKSFIEQSKSICGSSNWIYLLPFADKKEIIRLRKELDKMIYAVPMEQDPFYLSKEMNELFQQLLL